MNHQSETIDNASAAAPGRGGAHTADGDAGHSCEFCSPEPQIMPLPRSGAVRTSVQHLVRDGDGTLGELLT